MADIVERLRRKVFHGPTMEAAHTRTVEWQAADEIERLRAALKEIARYEIDEGCPCSACRHSAIALVALEGK